MTLNNRQNKNGIHLPANNSIRLSSYIAALDRYLDWSGFAFPVTHTREGVEYEFDLFYTGDSCLIKIFTQLNEKEFTKYECFDLDDDVLFIFDATDLTDEEPGETWFSSINDDFLGAAYAFQALVYLHGRLCNIVTDEDGEEIWAAMIPIQKQKCIEAIHMYN